jgi:hypothetical protein
MLADITIGFRCLPLVSTLICLASYGFRVMGAGWISVLVGGRVLFIYVFFSLVMICILLRRCGGGSLEMKSSAFVLSLIPAVHLVLSKGM